ncbi:MAG: hypothetical protein U0987_20710 [Afipia sp.]|nr:hypothetical protein [Afipia sp.]
MIVFFEGPHQRDDLLPIALCHVRVEKDWRLVCLGDQPNELVLPCDQPVHLFLQLRRREPFHDRADHLLIPPAQLCEFGVISVDRRVLLHPELVDVRRVLLAEFLNETRVHQAFLEDRQNGVLQFLLFDGAAIVAKSLALVAGRAASVACRRHLAHAAAAAAALEKIREEVFRALMLPELAGLQSPPLLQLFDVVPEWLIDQPHFGDFGAYPVLFRIETRHLAARAR